MSGNCTPNVDYVTLDSIGYRYDAAGNRTDQGGTYTTGNRITAFAGCTYSTDASGNIVSRKGSSPCVQIDTLLWTQEGWLDSLKVGTTGVKFLYDADGRLTLKRVNGSTVSWFLWDGGNLLAELTGSGNAVVTEYSYYGTDVPHAIIKQPAGTRLYARIDGLGNVVALTDTGAAILSNYVYDDWGSSGSSLDGNRARWKGALWIGPEIDAYYMRNRWYEPQTGRFFSEDPLRFPGSVNSMVFAGNDPVNGADPEGLIDPVTVWGVLPWWWGIGVADELWATQSSYYPGYWDYFSQSNGMPRGSTAAAPTAKAQKPSKARRPIVGICTQQTLAGPIAIDVSIAPEAARFINLAVLAGAQVRITSSFRTTAEQINLFTDMMYGRKKDYPVEWPGASRHEAGFSIDISWCCISKGSRDIIVIAAVKNGFEQSRTDPVHFYWTGGYGPYRNRADAIFHNQFLAQPGLIPLCE